MSLPSLLANRSLALLTRLQAHASVSSPHQAPLSSLLYQTPIDALYADETFLVLATSSQQESDNNLPLLYIWRDTIVLPVSSDEAPELAAPVALWRLSHVKQVYDMVIVRPSQDRALLVMLCSLIEEPTFFAVKVWLLDESLNATSATSLSTWKLPLPVHAALPPNNIFSIRSTFTKLAWAVSADARWLIIGTLEGRVMIFRGNLQTDKLPRTLTVVPSTMVQKASAPTAISSIQIYSLTAKDNVGLFVTSQDRVYWLVLQIALTRETKVSVALSVDEKLGALKPEAACSFSSQKLAIGRREAIYVYGNQGKPSTYLVAEGEKVWVSSVFQYALVIVSRLTSHANNSSHSSMSPRRLSPTSHGDAMSVTVYDPELRLILMQETFHDTEIIFAWSSRDRLYLWTLGNAIYVYEWGSLERQLNLFAKHQWHSVALQWAKRAKLSADRLAPLYGNYGDYLLQRGEIQLAMEQFIHTLGHVAPSVVIRQFLDHVDALILYLEALHQQHFSTSDHITLLCQCYARQGHTEKLETLLKSVPEHLLDADKIMDLCRSQPSLAFVCAQRVHDTAATVRILLNDMNDSVAALQALQSLSVDQQWSVLQLYGKRFVQEMPQAMLLHLVSLIKSADSLEERESLLTQALRFYVLNEKEAIPLLETFVYDLQSEEHCQTLLSLYLQYQQDKVLEFLSHPKARYDNHLALSVCQQWQCWKGWRYLAAERIFDWQALMMEKLDQSECTDDDIIKAAVDFGAKDDQVFEMTLKWLAEQNRPVAIRLLLEEMDKRHISDPLTVIRCLAAHDTVTLGTVKSYLLGYLKKKRQNQTKTQEQSQDLSALASRLEQLKKQTQTFQAVTCSQCQETLQLPVVYFRCRHAFHELCLSSEAEMCPVCDQKTEKSESQDDNRVDWSQLETCDDPSGLLADMFSRVQWT